MDLQQVKNIVRSNEDRLDNLVTDLMYLSNLILDENKAQEKAQEKVGELTAVASETGIVADIFFSVDHQSSLLNSVEKQISLIKKSLGLELDSDLRTERG